MKRKSALNTHPYCVVESKKQVVFLVPAEYPTTTMTFSLMRRYLPDDYNGVVVLWFETLYRLQVKDEKEVK